MYGKPSQSPMKLRMITIAYVAQVQIFLLRGSNGAGAFVGIIPGIAVGASSLPGFLLTLRSWGLSCKTGHCI